MTAKIYIKGGYRWKNVHGVKGLNGCTIANRLAMLTVAFTAPMIKSHAQDVIRRPAVKKARPKYIPKVGDWVKRETGKVGQVVADYETSFLIYMPDFVGAITIPLSSILAPALPRIDRTGGKLRIVHPNPYAKWGTARLTKVFPDDILLEILLDNRHPHLGRFFSKRSNAIRGLIRLSMSTGMSFEVEG